jgi:hypothetical protein
VIVLLDNEYGCPRLPLKVEPWEVSRSPKSKCLLTEEIGSNLASMLAASTPQLFRHAARTLTYIWAMDSEGAMHVAVEELAEMPDGTRVEGYPRRRNFPVHPSEEKKLGHPTLLDAGEARVAGELFLDEKEGNLYWFVNVSSGRYCRIVQPSEVNVSNVVKWFREIAHVDVRLDDIREG